MVTTHCVLSWTDSWSRKDINGTTDEIQIWLVTLTVVYPHYFLVVIIVLQLCQMLTEQVEEYLRILSTICAAF